MCAKYLLCGMILSFSASASVMVLEGNHPQPLQENVLLYSSSAPGQSIIGRTNSTNTLVDFSTLSGDLIISGSNGQSYITGVGGGSGKKGGMIADISIELAHGDPFTSLILALDLPGVGHASTCFGCIKYSATGSAAASGNLAGAIGPGTTFFTFVAPPGEELTSVTLSGVGWQRIEDIRQVRITPGAGHSAEFATAEPGTFLLVCGGALIALGAARRRRTRTT
jgi:hypothetical protein